ncbi:MAG TPA: tRNA (adenosine(37)-N6)-threonylcarbamoyltransferase complex dimerization subunit type 1 TsaB [Candidatus Saccharimonadales bacterium]|nr:tRNA (adenosine(37)-N6)-threonylcarbamoyltransferase complex dimerization subunit type 1 TsaB [Candidatus Saccharimonadales bacterium]
MILTIRTDNPEAEIGLHQPDGTAIAHYTWHAHRELADTLLGKIRDLLETQQQTFESITGLVVFQGPGSFTGLRIGITVANAFAYGRDIPIVGSQGEAWVGEGLAKLAKGENTKIVLPEYGAEAHITLPKK